MAAATLEGVGNIQTIGAIEHDKHSEPADIRVGEEGGY